MDLNLAKMSRAAVGWAVATALAIAAAPAAGGDEPPSPGTTVPTPPPPPTGEPAAPPAEPAPGPGGSAEPGEPPAPPAKSADPDAGAAPTAAPQRSEPPKAKPPKAKPPKAKPKKKAQKKKKKKKKKAQKKKKDKKKKAKKRKGKKRFRGCPKDMVAVRGQFCVDRYEAYVAQMLTKGRLKRHSPFKPVAGKKVKALNRRGRMPQAYISRHEAAQACENAGKRLCTDSEWVMACKGRRPTQYPYGKKWKPGRCNDQGVSSFNKLFGKDGKEPPRSAYSWDNLNDSRLNRPKGTCAPAGKFRKCRNSFKLYDMVGNLHEWTANPRGTFRGGYYLDVHQNGDGCDYKTTAHGPKYHDYSTGFRCCK